MCGPKTTDVFDPDARHAEGLEVEVPCEKRARDIFFFISFEKNVLRTLRTSNEEKVGWKL